MRLYGTADCARSTVQVSGQIEVAEFDPRANGPPRVPERTFVNFTGGTLLSPIAHICIITSFIAVIALFTAHALSALLEV